MLITTVVTISRANRISHVVSELSKAIREGFEHHLMIIIDNKTISAFELNKRIASSEFAQYITKLKVLNTGKRPPSNLDVPTRRNRIAACHKEARRCISQEGLVFGFEDDTILPEDVISLIYHSYLQAESISDRAIGFIEGVQVARWGVPYIGAWKREDDHSFVSLLQKSEFEVLEQITGGGLYCFLTPADLYCSASFSWEEPVGPDVWYGVECISKGYTNYIDWNLPCGHYSNEIEIWPEGKEVSIRTYVDNGRIKVDKVPKGEGI